MMMVQSDTLSHRSQQAIALGLGKKKHSRDPEERFALGALGKGEGGEGSGRKLNQKMICILVIFI